MAPVLAIRATQADMGLAAPALLGVWIFFNLISNTILLPLLVATFIFSSRAKRHPTLVNLCLTWFFSGEYSVMLFYAGKQNASSPGRGLCLAQTTLLYGITPMWSVAVLVFFYYMTRIVRSGPKTDLNGWRLVLMLVAPYIAQISFSISALFIGVQNPSLVSRSFRFLYCALRYPSLSLAMGIFTTIMCVGIVFLEVHLAIIAYRHLRGLRNAGQWRFSNSADFQFFLRVLVFGGYITFGMIVNIISVVVPKSVVPDIYAATAGTAVFLVFGTQPDVLNVWCFWKRPAPMEKRSIGRPVPREFPESTERSGSFDSLPEEHLPPMVHDQARAIEYFPRIILPTPGAAHSLKPLRS